MGLGYDVGYKVGEFLAFFLTLAIPIGLTFLIIHIHKKIKEKKQNGTD